MRIDPANHSSRIARVLPESLSATAKVPHLSALRAGEMLARELRTADGEMIAGAYARLTPLVVARLLNAGMMDDFTMRGG